MKKKRCLKSNKHEGLLLLFLVLLVSALVIIPSGCLDTNAADQDDDATGDQRLNVAPTDTTTNPEQTDDDTSVEPTDDDTSTEESAMQTVIASHSSGGSSSGSSPSSPPDSPDVSRTIDSGDDYTEPAGTITGDLTIAGTTTGTITLPSGLTVNGDLTVNTPDATVNNYANVGGTVKIIAVSVNTWNQYGNAGEIQMGAENATFNFFAGNVSGMVEMVAENTTFQFVAGNISQGVCLTQPSRVVINATATDLPEVTVTDGAEGSDIDNLGDEELELIAEANVTVAGTVNVTASTGVTTTERTARGSLSLSPTSAVYNTDVAMTVTYTVGEDLTDGVVNISVPAGFAVADTNGLTIAGAGTTVDANTNASYDGNKLTIENVIINEDQTIILALATQQVSSAGNYDFAATATNTSKLISNAATARFTATLNNDATLSDLTVDGTKVTGFNAATLVYTVDLPTGTTATPTVAATENDTNANAVVTPATDVTSATESNRTTTVVVTAEDGTTTKTYTILFNVTEPGAEITVDKTLQLTVNETATASTTEAGAGNWESDNSSVATINSSTGVITALSEGMTNISYTTSTSGLVNSTEVEVWPAPLDFSNDLKFTDATTTIHTGTKQLTGFPVSVPSGTTLTFTIKDGSSDVITVDNSGLVTYVADGSRTVRYEMTDDENGQIFEFGEVTITAEPAPAPTISFLDPVDGATGVVLLDADVRIQFSESLTEVDLSGVNITYNNGNDGVGNVVAALDADNQTILISHDAFSKNVTYNVTIPAGAVKNAGNTGNEEVNWSFTTVSDDAGLTSVLGKTDGSPAGGIGTSGDMITWAIDVANSVTEVLISDIVPATGASVNMSSDSGFSTENTSIALEVGNTSVYIKVTAEDTETVKYYNVTTTRA